MSIHKVTCKNGNIMTVDASTLKNLKAQGLVKSATEVKSPTDSKPATKAPAKTAAEKKAEADAAAAEKAAAEKSDASATDSKTKA